MNVTQVVPKTQPKTGPNIITIGDTEIRLLIYKGLPVVTFQMIDKVYGHPARTAVRNFEQNRSRFLDGEDFFFINQITKFVIWELIFPHAAHISSLRLVT